MMVLGLTGGVGAGKSRILELFSEEYGAQVIQADLVARQLEEGRPLCIRTQVTGPCYVEYSLSLRLLAGREVTEEQVRRWLWQQVGPLQAGIGRPLRKDDLAAVLQKLPGLWQVQQIDLGSLHPRCYRTAAGDLELPPDGVPWLGRLQIEWERM